MAATRCWPLENGNLAGEVRWSATPEVTYSLEITPGGVVIEFTARSDSGLTWRRVRPAPLGEMKRALRHRAVEDADLLAGAPEVVTLTSSKWGTVPAYWTKTNPARMAWERAARDLETKPTDVKHASIAAMYVRLLDEKEPRPVVALAQQLHLGHKTVRNYLFTARERGLLTSAGRGVAGGQLTDKARRLLDGEHQEAR